MKGAEWIANLLPQGLLATSFIPSAPQRELRDLTRYRAKLAEERVRKVNRLQKAQEDTNLKLGDGVSSIKAMSASRNRILVRFTRRLFVDGVIFCSLSHARQIILIDSCGIQPGSATLAFRQ